MRALRRTLHRDQAKSRHRLRLPLESKRLDRLGLDRFANQLKRLLSYQHLVWLRSLLQTGRDVDRVTRREPLIRANDDLACVDTDPPLNTHLRKRLSHLRCGATGTQRVVLVHGRHTENGHDGVADELLHTAPVQIDDRAHALEVAAEQGLQRLGIRRLAERSRAHHVAKHHRHNLAMQGAIIAPTVWKRQPRARQRDPRHRMRGKKSHQRPLVQRYAPSWRPTG